MENETEDVRTQSVVENAVEHDRQVGRMPYHAPTLNRFGGLVELVKNNPGFGTDGNPGPDCTHS
jgi:hypothetical protein